MQKTISSIHQSQNETLKLADQARSEMHKLNATFEGIATRIKSLRSQATTNPAHNSLINESEILLKSGLQPRLVRMQRLHKINSKYLADSQAAIANALRELVSHKEQTLQEMTGLLLEDISSGQIMADAILKKLADAKADQPEYQ